MKVERLYTAICNSRPNVYLVVRETNSGKEYAIECVEETRMFNSENDVCTIWIRPIETEDDE